MLYWSIKLLTLGAYNVKKVLIFFTIFGPKNIVREEEKNILIFFKKKKK